MQRCRHTLVLGHLSDLKAAGEDPHWAPPTSLD
jgi:hypothetical protein